MTTRLSAEGATKAADANAAGVSTRYLICHASTPAALS
jgi:hypothetical protein